MRGEAHEPEVVDWPKPANDEGRKRRALRYRLLETARQITGQERLRKCMRCARAFAGISVRVGAEGRAHYAGLVRCGSVWLCPVCSQGIAMERAEEVRTLLKRHRGTGGGDYLLTCTTPHDLGDALKPMRRHVARAWRFVVSGAPWKRIQARYGLAYVRAQELTHGRNGWHPHLHIVLLSARPLTAAAQVELEAFVLRRWQRAIAKPDRETGTTYRVPLAGVGVKLTSCGRRDDYVTKLGLADELAHGAAKRGHEGHRTPFQILRDIWQRDFTVQADIALWVEYASEMPGCKQLTWSRGLRKRYAIAEQTDLELADREEAMPAPITVYQFEDAVWAEMIAPLVGERIRILHLAEDYPPLEAAERIGRLVDRVLGIIEVPF